MELASDKKWKGRIYLHNILKEKVTEDVEKMVYAVLAKDRMLEIEKGDFDPNPYCHDSNKSNCLFGRGKKYQGKINADDRVFYGDSHLDIYLQVVNFYLVRDGVFPCL